MFVLFFSESNFLIKSSQISEYNFFNSRLILVGILWTDNFSTVLIVSLSIKKIIFYNNNFLDIRKISK